MSVLQHPGLLSEMPEPKTAPGPRPRAHRWTIEEYQKISDIGLLANRRTELMDGEIIDKAAQNEPHALTISKANRVLVATFDDQHYWLKIQSTTRLDEHNAPEPDFAVLEGPPVARGNKPERPLLVIEVSDTTLLYDQIVKSSLYARHGILDYWIINLIDRQVEVYRDPVEDSARIYGWRYASTITYRPPGYVVPLCKADCKIEVARVLP